MYSFDNDYSEGAHENIIRAVVKSNMEQTCGYGLDSHCDNARTLISKYLKSGDSDIHFLVGGTQTNLAVIGGVLRSYEAAIAAESGHVLVHETGAIEATGHKVISVPSQNGKITAEDVRRVVKLHTDEHMVHPKLVYISNPTEIGTIYNKKELETLRQVCDENDLYLYLDGARLASALTSKINDLSLEDINTLTDAFYIGGTKCGAFMGEALVISNNEMKKDFRYIIKQRGAMLAKGRMIGIQFEELFEGNLYFRLGDHSNKMADLLREGIDKAGYKYMIDTATNQIFPVFPNEIIEKLGKKYKFSVWKKENESYSTVRLVTSWATVEEKVLEFVNDIKNC